MAKRIHRDPQVKSCSVGGKVFERAADGSFDIPSEFVAHLASHGFVEPPKVVVATPAAIVQAGEGAPIAPEQQPRKRGRRG